MPIITFGSKDPPEAIIVYDRQTKICIILATTLTDLPDAVATARTLKADTIWVIAPMGAEGYVGSIELSYDFNLYWLK